MKKEFAEAFQGALGGSEAVRCISGRLMKYKEHFKGFHGEGSREFQDVTGAFQMRSKGDFTKSSGVSGVIQGVQGGFRRAEQEDLRGISGGLREFQGVIQSLKGVLGGLRGHHRTSCVFQGVY